MKQALQRANPSQKQKLEGSSLGALPGHMTGLTTDQREDRLGRDGQTSDKRNIDEADQNTTHGIRNFQQGHKGRNLLGEQDFHKTITITHSREIVKAAVIHTQDLAII